VEYGSRRSYSFVDDGSTVNFHDGGAMEVIGGVIEGVGCVADTIVILDDGTLTEDERRAYVVRLMTGIKGGGMEAETVGEEARESYGLFP